MWFLWVEICGFMSGSDQFLLPGFLDHLYPLVDREFAIDILNVELNRVEAEEQVLPDLFITLPGRCR